jgi:hypothetical protein
MPPKTNRPETDASTTTPLPVERRPTTQAARTSSRPRRALVVGALALAALGAAAALTPRFRNATVETEPPLPAWGRVEHVDLYLEQPPQNVRPTDCISGDPVWVLPGVRTPSQARGLFQNARLPEVDAEGLLAETRCEAGVCRTTPPRAIVERLPSDARGRLYDRLARSLENGFHAFPYTRPADEPRWAPIAAIVGADLLGRLEWKRGGQVHLTDFEVLCRAADTDAERVTILESVSRMSAAIAWLTIREGDPIDPLVRYWGRSARTRDLRPILEAMARVPGGGRLDLMHLLPPFARRRMNTFPREGDPPRDCFWTALHFFDVNTPPDEFLGAAGMPAILARDYEAVNWEARQYGDLILFLDRQGTLLHAANHIAGDLVFTKNGFHPRRPWTLLRLDEVRDVYADATELRAFHLRRLPAY